MTWNTNLCKNSLHPATKRSKSDTFLFPWNLLRNISSIDKNTGSPVFIPFGHCFEDVNSHFYGLAAL